MKTHVELRPMNALALLLAVAAAALMLLAVGVMTTGDLGVAGILFLSASILIYVRETQL